MTANTETWTVQYNGKDVGVLMLPTDISVDYVGREVGELAWLHADRLEREGLR